MSFIIRSKPKIEDKFRILFTESLVVGNQTANQGVVLEIYVLHKAIVEDNWKDFSVKLTSSAKANAAPP